MRKETIVSSVWMSSHMVDNVISRLFCVACHCLSLKNRRKVFSLNERNRTNNSHQQPTFEQDDVDDRRKKLPHRWWAIWRERTDRIEGVFRSRRWRWDSDKQSVHVASMTREGETNETMFTLTVAHGDMVSGDELDVTTAWSLSARWRTLANWIQPVGDDETCPWLEQQRQWTFW